MNPLLILTLAPAEVAVLTLEEGVRVARPAGVPFPLLRAKHAESRTEPTLRVAGAGRVRADGDYAPVVEHVLDRLRDSRDLLGEGLVRLVVEVSDYARGQLLAEAAHRIARFAPEGRAKLYLLEVSADAALSRPTPSGWRVCVPRRGVVAALQEALATRAIEVSGLGKYAAEARRQLEELRRKPQGPEETSEEWALALALAAYVRKMAPTPGQVVPCRYVEDPRRGIV